MNEEEYEVYEYIHTYLKYEPEIGIFIWIDIPASYHRAKIGDIAGSYNSSGGYYQLYIKGKQYRQHKLAWLYVYGEWPKGDIYHINRDRSDNRWYNLKLKDSNIDKEPLQESNYFNKVQEIYKSISFQEANKPEKPYKLGIFCLNCTNELVHKQTKYCSQKCQHEYTYNQYIERWKQGLEKGHKGKAKAISNPLRRYLLNKYNNTCIKCGWNELHPSDNKPLVEINHIDGDAENCKEDNLEVLCPNCHSKTYNYKFRNKNCTRVRYD